MRLRMLGSEVLTLIQKYLIPFSFCGELLRMSGSNAVVSFHIPSEVIQQKAGKVKGLTSLLYKNNIRYVDGVDGAEQLPVEPERDVSEGKGTDDEVLVSFTIPSMFCVSFIQRILEKAHLLEHVASAIESGRLLSAIRMLTLLLEDLEIREHARAQCSAVYAFRAQLHYQLRKYTDAISDGNVALNLDPSQIEGYSVISKSYLQMGDKEAAAHFEQIARWRFPHLEAYHYAE